MAKKIGRIQTVRQIRGKSSATSYGAVLRRKSYYVGTIKPLNSSATYSYKVSFNRKPYKNQMVEFEVGATGRAIKVRPKDSSIYN